MREKIDALLLVVSEVVDDKQLSYIPENFSGIPPTASEVESEAGEDDDRFRLKEKNSTRKPGDDPQPTPEAITAWKGIEDRLNASKIRSVDIQLRVDKPPLESPGPPDDTVLYLQYRHKIDQMLSRKMAGGMTQVQAYNETQKEVEEFDDFKKRVSDNEAKTSQNLTFGEKETSENLRL
jgi:hypothetical protein